MAGDGITIRGQNGILQIDSEFLQPYVIRELTIPGELVQVQDAGVSNQFSRPTWSNSWNYGSHIDWSGGAFYYPTGYGPHNALVFAKPTEDYRYSKLGMRVHDYGDGNIVFGFHAPEAHTNIWGNGNDVDVIVCGTEPGDASDVEENFIGIEVYNDFDDLIYSSNRKAFVGEQVATNTPQVSRYGPAVEGIGLYRENYEPSTVEIRLLNRTADANKDVYVLMDPTASMISYQSWGSYTHPLGPRCFNHQFWPYVCWDIQDVDTSNPNYGTEQKITMKAIEKVIEDDGGLGYTRTMTFIDYNYERSLLVGRFR